MNAIKIKAGSKQNHIVDFIKFMTHVKTFADQMGLRKSESKLIERQRTD